MTPLVFGLLSATSVRFPVGTPNRLLWSDKFGPFLLRRGIPVSPGFLAGPPLWRGGLSLVRGMGSPEHVEKSG